MVIEDAVDYPPYLIGAITEKRQQVADITEVFLGTGYYLKGGTVLIVLRHHGNQAPKMLDGLGFSGMPEMSHSADGGVNFSTTQFLVGYLLVKDISYYSKTG